MKAQIKALIHSVQGWKTYIYKIKKREEAVTAMHSTAFTLLLKRPLKATPWLPHCAPLFSDTTFSPPSVSLLNRRRRGVTASGFYRSLSGWPGGPWGDLPALRWLPLRLTTALRIVICSFPRQPTGTCVQGWQTLGGKCETMAAPGNISVILSQD